jgi:hypothetical protein
LSSIARAVRFARANWLVLTVVALMLPLAGTVGYAIYVDEQKGVRDQQSGSYADQRIRPADPAVAPPDTEQAPGEQSTRGQPAGEELDGSVVERAPNAIRPVERAGLRLAAWSAWIGLFVGVIASLIALAQIPGPGRRRTGAAVARRCVVCVAANRESGELAISLVNVGSGAAVLADVAIRDGTGRDLIALPGLVIDTSDATDLVVFPPLVLRPDQLDVAANFDGGGSFEATFRKDVATGSYVLVRQAEVH